MNLWTLIEPEIRTVSLIGMGKNVGKTVVLNRLIKDSGRWGYCLGLTSIGRDGEREDLVTGTEKPGIQVPPETLLATAHVCMARSDARMEILETTDQRTSMGGVVLVKVRQRGSVQLAGPDSNQGIAHVCARMLALGADKVLVDGALDRKASASPAITDATILATGAVVNREMARVVKDTAHQVMLLALPRWDCADAIIPEKDSMDAWLQEGQGVGIVRRDGTLEVLSLMTALNSGSAIGRGMKQDDLGILIRGSLTEKTVKDLMASTVLYTHVPMVVEDATRVFIGESAWRLFRKQGLMVNVLRRNRLAFVTANPWSPGGWCFDEKLFMSEMRKAITTVPVINVMAKEAP